MRPRYWREGSRIRLPAAAVVRAVSGCDAGCPYCPIEDRGPPRGFLDLGRLELFLDSLIGSGLRPDVYFTCPDPLAHPALGELASSATERGLRSHVFVPASGCLRGRPEKLLGADEIFLFSHTTIDLKRAKRFVRKLLTSGKLVKLMPVYVPGLNDEEVWEMVNLGRSWGLQVWVSPPLFCPVTKCPSDVLRAAQSRGYDLSDPFGEFMGVYEMRVTFHRDFPVYLLSGPRCRADCRLIYMDPSGLVGKCPMLGRLNPAFRPEELREIIESGCDLIERSASYSFVPSLRLVTKSGEVLEEDYLELLSMLESAGSLSAVARSLGLSTPAVYKRLKRMESALGFRLFVSWRGGAGRGGVALTPEALELVRSYRRYRAGLGIVRFSSQLKEQM